MKQLSLPEPISCSDRVLPGFFSLCFMHRTMLLKQLRSMESGGCECMQHGSAVIIKHCYLLYIMIRHQSLWIGCALHCFSEHLLPAELCWIFLVSVIRGFFLCVCVCCRGGVKLAWICVCVCVC